MDKNKRFYDMNYGQEKNEDKFNYNIRPNPLIREDLTDNGSDNLISDDELSNEEKENVDKNSQDIEIIELSNEKEKEFIDLKNIGSFGGESFSEEKIKKNKIIPELTTMCSENEMLERSKNKDLDILEIDYKVTLPKKMDKKRMIQKYKRKNGSIVNLGDPKELRTPRHKFVDFISNFSNFRY
jgi:hypothetical protein